MIDNNALVVVAKRYYTFLKVGYITFAQFLTRIDTLIDLLDYSANDISIVRNKLINIRLKGNKYRK